MFLHFIYLICTIIITYEIITLTNLAKRLKFSENNPQAVYWFVIICIWREYILSGFTHSFLLFPSKSNFCTKMLEDLVSFVIVWQKKPYLEEQHRIRNGIYCICLCHDSKISQSFIQTTQNTCQHPAQSNKNGDTLSVIYKTCYVIQLTVYLPQQMNISLS
jgi:hypothetical protein